MGVMDRARRIWRSRRHDADAEQWGDRLDASARDQAALLQQLRRSLADLATHRRRVELQLTRLRQQSGALDAEAQAAVAAGNDDAARSALTRKVTIDKAVGDLEGRHATLQADEQKMQATAERLAVNVEDFRVRKDTLTARQSAAAARAELHRASRDIGADGSAARDLESVERHTREMEATADAYDELVASDPTRDAASWDRAFGQDDGQIHGQTEGGDDGPHQISR